MDKEYIAFISYRHVPLDEAVAKTLHRQIERYVIPRKLRKAGKRFGTVFRDREGMAASSNLRQNLKDALDQSEYLIVVCSPDTAKTGWVGDEIEYFLQNHPRNKVFTVLAKGEANSVIPEILQYDTDPESGEPVKVTPLAVDARGRTIRASCRKLRHEITKLYAGMLGCSHDDLAERTQRRFRRRLTAAFLSALLVTLSFTAVVLGKNLEIEKKNQEIEQQNQEISNQYQELKKKNEELDRQKTETQLRESELLTQNAWEALAAGDRYSAIESAVAALPTAEGERPYYAPAEQALIAAMGYLEDEQIGFISMHKTLENKSKISDYCIAAAGSRIISVDRYGLVSCFDTKTGDILWQSENAFEIPQILYCELYNSVIVSDMSTVQSLSLDTGEILWNSDESEFYFYERPLLSRDQRILVGLVTSYSTEDRDYLYAFSAETGEILQRVAVSGTAEQDFVSEQSTKIFRTWYDGNDIACSLSDTGDVYFGSFDTYFYSGKRPNTMSYYRVDLSSGTCSIISPQPEEPIGRTCYFNVLDGGQKNARDQSI